MFTTLFGVVFLPLRTNNDDESCCKDLETADPAQGRGYFRPIIVLFSLSPFVVGSRSWQNDTTQYALLAYSVLKSNNRKNRCRLQSQKNLRRLFFNNLFSIHFMINIKHHVKFISQKHDPVNKRIRAKNVHNTHKATQTRLKIIFKNMRLKILQSLFYFKFASEFV